jgi:hypothetical protein
MTTREETLDGDSSGDDEYEDRQDQTAGGGHVA